MTWIPHPWQNQFHFLELSILKDNTAVTMVALNRPEKRNAIHADMWREIGTCFSALGTQGDGCRCVLLRGNGSNFCAGIDTTDPTFLIPSGDVARVGIAFLPKVHSMQDAFTALERCPVPVVAVIHGTCIGAGVDLICAASVRLAVSDAQFSVREVELGLAADVGTLQRLPKITGNGSLAYEVCLSGRNFSVQEALSMGLISRASTSAMQDGLEICQKIAKHSPVAVLGTKKALLYARDHTVQEGLDQIASFNALALQGDDLSWTMKKSLRQEKVAYKGFPMFSRL